MTALNEKPLATILNFVLAFIVTCVGAAGVLTGDLAFREYVFAVAGLSVGNGLLGVGRGILNSNRSAT